MTTADLARIVRTLGGRFVGPTAILTFCPCCQTEPKPGEEPHLVIALDPEGNPELGHPS